jgi:hypothetical protein
MDSIMSEDDLRSLLKRRSEEGQGDATGTEDEMTTDYEGDVVNGDMVIDGGEGELEMRAARMVEEPTVATPMGLAGAEGQLE